MDAGDLIRQAWDAVQQSGVPKELHETAFKEAFAYLRGDEAPAASASRSRGSGRTRRSTAKRASKSTGKRTSKAPRATQQNLSDAPAVAPGKFFAQLAQESGVDENELKEVFHLTDGNRVEVAPPTRRLGKSRTAQAKTVIALVAGARHAGLGEKPVSAEAVRRELDRKNSLDRNFAHYHIGPLKGFNLSGKTAVVVNPKWVEEFDAAVGRVVGRADNDG